MRYKLRLCCGDPRGEKPHDRSITRGTVHSGTYTGGGGVPRSCRSEECPTFCYILPRVAVQSARELYSPYEMVGVSFKSTLPAQ